ARVLGGEIKAAVPYGEGTPDMPVAPEQKNWLMHCWLEIGDQAIMGADMGKEGAPSIDKPKNGFDVTLISTIRTRRRPWVDVPRRKAASEQVIQSRQSRAGKSVAHRIPPRPCESLRLGQPALATAPELLMSPDGAGAGRRTRE